MYVLAFYSSSLSLSLSLSSVSLENYDRPTNQQTNFRVHWEATHPIRVGPGYGSGLLQEVGSGSGQYQTGSATLLTPLMRHKSFTSERI